MNFKKSCCAVIAICVLTTSVPLQSMEFPLAGDTFQTLLNFISILGLDTKDFLIDQTKNILI